MRGPYHTISMADEQDYVPGQVSDDDDELVPDDDEAFLDDDEEPASETCPGT